ncbi:BcCCH1, calcium channel protein [Amylocarpus encephaloides]|uniref:Calcium-channel protein CCH1 n=1 Tax=Amylocarpus encephaloides TaxID=45428 RepID=A0A9P8CBQ5_9HELO|nr:BcCCH1, calcium channel protein [Amylocarpus encephaloides]
MPSPNPQDRPHPSTPPGAIPLRDLEPPPESADIGDGRRQHTRGRSLLGGLSRPTSGHSDGPQYERLRNTSPTPRETTRTRQTAPLSIPNQGRGNDGSEAVSPVDPLEFAIASSFSGLAVPDINISHAPTVSAAYSPSPFATYGSQDIDFMSPSPYGDGGGDDIGYSSTYFSTESDSIPLTDASHLQPISGAAGYSSGGQGHDRSGSFHSINFDSSDSAVRRRSSRPGDGYGGSGHGLSPSSGRSRAPSYGNALTPEGRNRSRSPSTTSGAFLRAGSIVRAMSQRVVNISGEAEYIEASARRATRVSRVSRESSLPTMTGRGDEEEARFQPKHRKDPLAADPNTQANLPTAPVEKAIKFFGKGEPDPSINEEDEKPPNPLRGKSLGIFSADSKIRNWLCDLLVYPFTEPVILILIMVQTILLAVESSSDVFKNPRPMSWGGSIIDYAILGLFIIFTLELVARIIVSGLIMNAPEYSSSNRAAGAKAVVMERYHTIFKPQRNSSLRAPRPSPSISAQTVIRSFTAIQGDQVKTVEQAQRLQLARRAFLRHGFNRLDFVAVLAFWAAFVLGVTGLEQRQHLYVFRMLSCLRILRLLALTHGTAIILRSLKKAAPLLVNVSFLIGFFWLLFAIIGVQSFKSSFDRQCVWVDPSDPLNKTGTAWINSGQFCGGQFINNASGGHETWKLGPLDGNTHVDNLTSSGSAVKGYLCAEGSYCLQLQPSQLPFNGTVSFDNIFQSLELVFVVMTANTWSDLMYHTMDSDYLATALFFASSIMIMMLWLLNLLIAVITSSFQVIREEGKASAFAAHVKGMLPTHDPEAPHRLGAFKRIFDKTYWFWIIAIAFDLVCQACRSASMSENRAQFINNAEVVVTFLLLVEIILRFAVDWRGFTRNKKNWFDLGLVVITTIILLPPIRNSERPYAWLTLFQLMRIYRVIIAVPITRQLITLVLGNSSGIANLMLFVFLITFLISIFAVQLFRGELAAQDANGDDTIATFATIYNAFLGMYQVLSSEDWTSILYNVTGVGRFKDTGWIGAAFFIGWFILANFILVNMFIAVIQENFDVSEDEKRMHQVKAFLNRKELGDGSSNLSLSAIFRFGKSRTAKDPLDYGPATMEMLLKDAVVKDFLDDEIRAAEQATPTPDTPPAPVAPTKQGVLGGIRGKFTRVFNREPNPFYSNIQFSSRPDDTTDARTLAKEAVSATSQRKKAQRDFLARHPTYNNALYIFKPSNPIRRVCQRIVGPGRGSERIDGVEPHRVVWYAFSAFIYAAIVAMVLLACVTTPLYQKEYFDKHTFSVRNWFVWVDMSFALVFSVEALIKAIADGLFWTPNAYFRSSWGMIDLVVLVTFWISVITSFKDDGEISRAVGAFKALRALRLLNVSDSARETFHSLIIVGGSKFFSAAFVSLSLLIPFAIYGLNLFNGQLVACSDDSGITNLNDCFGEYQATPYNDAWPMIAPRVASNQWFNFDDFGNSLFLLFQLTSQEGWIDVMWAAESITGRGLQPRTLASQGNAVFFVMFNLLATVFVLTLFISVFMRNYTEQTGVAFLTADQRSWLELRKLLKQVSPSKRPSTAISRGWKDWCYKRAVRKHGKWQRAMTIILVLHLILLLVEYYPESSRLDTARNWVFVVFTAFYMANLVIRIVGLSWSRFWRSSWDVFSILAIGGTLVSTIILLVDGADGKQQQIYVQLHKLFLVSVVLLLIPRNDALDQLFKTAAASLTNIGNLLATWFVFFLVFAIALTQTFGLTRFGSDETGNLNFRSVPKALILLFKMSAGEGWNHIMMDFASIEPPLCIRGESFFRSDCGSTNWAYALFITWNILSMYIFVSLFVSLIYESFSYVYQHSSGLGKVSREELRRFKQAWATLDPEGTGYITKEQFPRLLGELSGVFSMRIYDHENSVQRILEDIQTEGTSGRISSMAATGGSSGVDLKALNKRLALIDPAKVRKTRARYNLFFEEVMVSADIDRGISFTTVLMILAHYNVISDSKSLRLEEFLRRRARIQRVEEEIRRRVVLGFFDTMYWSRRFRRHLEKKRSGRMTDVPQLGPEVYVDYEEEATPQARPRPTGAQRLSPMDGTVDPRTSFITHGLDGVDGARRHRPQESSTSSFGGFASLGGPLSPASPGRSPQLSPHRPTNSNISLEAGELSGQNSASSSRRGSAVSAENVLEVLDNSAWGESIRKSFTVRRPNRGGGGTQ